MREIFWHFLKLGWLSFGGPVGNRRNAMTVRVHIMVGH